ncbi:MAG: nucleotidyltransferase domain-containing protein [Deltaproteobacteria bacterium]|nr:nucleotidyltransferase domain-containing protein [Deltaproteobacteria bacterium]
MQRLVAEFAALRVVWFGSRALGQGHPGSDFDLLVVADTEAPLHERLFRAQWATRDVPVARDVVVVTPAECAAYGAWRSGVVGEALSQGLVLHDVGG